MCLAQQVCGKWLLQLSRKKAGWDLSYFKYTNPFQFQTVYDSLWLWTISTFARNFSRLQGTRLRLWSQKSNALSWLTDHNTKAVLESPERSGDLIMTHGSCKRSRLVSELAPSTSIHPPASSHLFHYHSHPVRLQAGMAFICSPSRTPEFPWTEAEQGGLMEALSKGRFFMKQEWGTFSHTHNSAFVLKCYCQYWLNKGTTSMTTKSTECPDVQLNHFSVRCLKNSEMYLTSLSVYLCLATITVTFR